MKKHYGLPYQGSKGTFADQIIGLMPNARHFYDLFGGGGAITDCACRSGKFGTVHYNDYDKFVVDYVQGALDGSFDTKHFVGREEYKEDKKTNPYARYVWSTRNCGGSYLFSESKLVNWTKEQLWDKVAPSVDRIQSFAELKDYKLTVSQSDYAKVHTKSDSVIYCDIPYRNTKGYKVNNKKETGMFDWDSFYDWCERQNSLVLVSEYSMPESRFVPLNWEVRRAGSYTPVNYEIDRLFIPKVQIEMYLSLLDK